MSIENFTFNVLDFEKLAASQKIDFFIFFHTVILNNDGVNNKQIAAYFDELKMEKYSNIPQYLKLNAIKGRGKKPKFIIQKGLYHLEHSRKSEIEAMLKIPKSIAATNNYFPLELFNNTRGYLESIATQAANCYDLGLFDACAVMTRKLLEVLIIESFERFKISSKVKNAAGNFFYLSDLIEIFKSESSWNIGRNAKSSLPNLKKMGDLSAHNRRYFARKPDLEIVKNDLRIVLEELIHLIDYPNWKHE
jgi:hypothetical protein